MSFSEKRLSISITGDGVDITLNNLRTSVECQIVGGQDMSTAAGAVFGLTLSQINELTATQRSVWSIMRNIKITITASDESSSNASVFGPSTLVQSWMDSMAMPEVCWRFVAQSGAFESVMKAKPTTFKGPTDASQIFQQLAQKMNLQFEDGGVKAKLSNPYFWGSYRSQALSAVQHIGCQWLLHNGVLAVWPTDKNRQSASPSGVISRTTGMVGYPAFNESGVVVTSLFRPDVIYGGQIQVQSDLQPANGSWDVHKIIHQLDALTPHGRWFSVIEAHDPHGVVQSGNQG